MVLAAQAGTPVKKLVLNDVGPFIPRAALERIGGHVGNAPAFASLEEAERYVREIAAPFGLHSDAQWRFLTETWVRKDDAGPCPTRYAQRIADAYPSAFAPNDL